MANITLTVGNISNNGVPCKNPVIIVLGTTGDISFPCSKKIGSDGKIKISIPDDLFANKCITLIVRCDECDSCPEKEVTVCLCNDSNDCEACSECRDGICVELCPDKLCVNGSCCDCATTADCNPGFLCDGCNCNCLGKVNSRGECVECLKDSECGPCQLCLNGVCTDIVCPANLICIGGGCGCPRGTVFDQTTGVCIPDDECTDDSQCAECETCVAGFCQPIICPPNYRCVDGECIYWPCTDVTCNNGADCGVDCGCLNGECVPCYLLDCADIASCPSALGCKCNNLEQCVPVDNCGQYCDGSTPCLEPNCTCYNNRCVDCSNFPCPEDCATHYNCGCNAEGDCEGGAGCNDTIVLLKKENCGTDLGCELVAEYTTTNECGCEPIEVRVNNEKSCTAPTPATGDILSLRVELFKNNRPYQDFRNQISIGDDELVQAVVTTTVLHYVKDNTGQWVLTSVPATAVDNVVAIDNKFDPIPLTNAHIKNTFSGKPTKVVVELRIEGVSIPNNDCIDYDSKVIATYELDYSNYTATCAKINGEFKVIKNTFLNDNESVRRPLFVWSKSTTSTFANTKFKNDTGVYAQSGWFRKEYGNLIAGKWTDKLNDPKRFAQDQYNELWNNYNYKVKVDCGCKSNDATLQKVIFCCPKEFDYTITDCGRTITIPPFDTCSVNKYLGGLFNQDYIIPAESQTFYWMIINGTTEISLKPSGGNLTTPFPYEHSDAITSVAFEQRYNGNPLVATACPVSYVETPVLPDFTFTIACNPAIIEVLKSANPSVTEVKVEKTSGIGFPATTLTLSNQSTKFTSATEPINSPYNTPGSFRITAKFSNGCMNTKTFDIAPSCGQEVVIVATPSVVAKSGCISGGSDPDIQATATGFGADVQYSINGGAYQTSPIFEDKGPGIYTVTAKGTVNGITGDVFAVSNEIEIVAAKQPVITSTPLCGNNTGTITISNGSPGSTFSVTKDGVLLPSPAVLNASGSWMYTVPSNGAGVYAATLVTDPNGLSCSPVTISTTVTAGGQTVAPTIIMDPTGCQGGVMHFTITDGGLNRTYNLTATGGNLGTPVVTANGGFPLIYTFTPTATSGVSITVRSSQNPCDTLVPHTYNVTGVSAGPTQVSPTGQCSTEIGPNGYLVTVVTEGAVTGVKLTKQDGVEIYAILFSPNVWKFDDFYSDSLYLTVTAFNSSGCSKTEGFYLNPCDPEVGSITISSNSPTCGQMNTTVNVTSVDFGYIENEFYQWYQVIGGLDVAISTPGVIVGGNVPPLTVYSTNSQLEYKVKIFKANGSTAESNVAGVVAGNTFTPVINGSSTATTGALTQYSASPMADSYLWTLSNSTVINQVIGRESSVGVVFAYPDNNVISLTSTTELCGPATTTKPVISTASCLHSVEIPSTFVDSCTNISPTIVSSGVTILSWDWINNDTLNVLQSGSGSVLPFDASVLSAGTTTNIRLRVTFSDMCLILSNVSAYQRCSCLCSTANVCSDVVAFIPAPSIEVTNNIQVINSDIYVQFRIGGYPDRISITRQSDSQLLLDTYQVGTNVAVPPVINYRMNPAVPGVYYQSFDLDLVNADAGFQTGIAVGADIIDLRTRTGVSCNDVRTAGTANDPAFFPVVYAGVTAVRAADIAGEKIINITIPSVVHQNSILTIVLTPGQLQLCQTENVSGMSSNGPAAYVSCTPF